MQTPKIHISTALKIFLLSMLIIATFDYGYALAQKLQHQSSLSSAEKKYRQFCVKKEECALYSELRVSFGSASATDQDLINKIENCDKQLDKIRAELGSLLKKEGKVLPLNTCK